MADASFWLDHGQQFPYAEGFQPQDAADKAALAICSNLGDRRGIKQELRAVDDDVRHELVRDLAEIIRAAYGVPAASKPVGPPNRYERLGGGPAGVAGGCGLCKGTGIADLPDPWGGVRGTCPDCNGTGGVNPSAGGEQ